MAHIYLVTDGSGRVRAVSVVAFSMTDELRAYRDELQRSIDAGTFRESQIPEQLGQTHLCIVKG